MAGAWLRDHVRVDDRLDVSSPRGSFVLGDGEGPVVLLSAGIGATPVMAMLYALATTHTARPVVWLHGARDGQHHPFAAEVRRLMGGLTHGRCWVCYSAPGSADTMPGDYDVAGHLSRAVFERVGIPRDADVYLCGPARFMAEMKETLAALGVAPDRVRVELFNGNESLTPGVVGVATRAPHVPDNDPDTGPAGVVRAERHLGALEPVGLRRACWSWPRRAMSRSAGRAGPACATTARAAWYRERSSTRRSRSTGRPKGTCSSAARGPGEISS